MMYMYPRSFLDRFLRGPEVAMNGLVRVDLEDFLDGLKRDVEDLLNTSSIGRSFPEWAEECADSILDYGLPDRAYFSGEPEEAARAMAATIARFEPRLDQVRVEVIGPDPARPERYLLGVRARLVDQPRYSVLLASRPGPDRSELDVTLLAARSDER